MEKKILFGIVLFLTVMMSYGKDFYNLNYIRNNNVFLNENLACTTYTTSSVTATPSCAPGKTSSVTINSSASGLPIDTYIVTYSLGYNGNSTSYTASMNVTTAGTGNFTANLGIVNLTSSSTVRIDRITSTTSSCFSNITSNNVSNVSYMHAVLTAPNASNGSYQCDRKWLAQWQPNSTRDGYYLDVAIDANFTIFFPGYENKYIAGGDTQSEVISNLEYGGIYYYRVRAKTYCGTSANSSTITININGNNSSTPGTIGGGASSICVGNTTTFTKDPNTWPSTGTWSIFNQTGSATITQGGVVTGVSPGTVLVVFTTQNGGCGSSSRRALTIDGATFTTVPSSSICSNVDATYTTQSGKSNYVWTISGNLGTDYTISAGNTTTNSVTLKWLTGGSKTVSVNYSGGCSGSPATNTITVNNTSAPTGTASQSFCSGASPTVANLIATGTAIKWYSVASGGSALASTATLTNGAHYFASQTVNGCESTTRFDVTATVNTTVAPTGTASQSFCSGASPMVANLIATGTAIKWYSVASGGSALASTATLTNGAHYFASQTVNGCESTTRFDVTATVNTPDKPTGTASQSFCSGASPTVANLIATGTAIKWYSVASGGSALASTATLTNGAHYFASQTVNGCESTTRFDVTVTVSTTPDKPTVGTITQPNCSKLTGSVKLEGLPLSGNWTVTRSPGDVETTGTGVETTISGLVAGTTYTFTFTADGGCTSAPSTAVVINAPPVIATWNGSWSFAPTQDTRVEFIKDYSSETDLPVNANNVLNACSCYVKDNAKVTFDGKHTLKVENEVKIESGSLTFINNASLVQVNDAAVNTGNVIYKRETGILNRYDFTYWSSPVADMTLGLPSVGLSPTTFFDKYFSYINVKVWALESRATVMKKGVGYSVRAPQSYKTTGSTEKFTASFEGVPNNGVVTLSGLAASQAHLLGNPYPSAIDADVFLDLNSKLDPDPNKPDTRVLEGTLYFWTHNTPPSEIAGDKKYNYTTADYATYNRTGGVSTVVSAKSDPNHSVNDVDRGVKPTGKIAAGQGFFAPTKAGGDVVFNNSMRVVGEADGKNNTQFFKLSTGKTAITTVAKTEKSRIWLNLTNSEGAFKQTLVGYIAGATNEYDGSFDGVTYDGNQFVDFYSVNNQVNLAIQGRALPFVKKDSVALGYKSTIIGDFQISIDETDGVLSSENVFLEDKELKVLHDLKKEAYTFSTQKGTFNNRFVLRYVDKNAIDLVPEIPANSNTAVTVSVKNGKINVNSPVELIDRVIVYDVAGRKLYLKNKVTDKNLIVENILSSHQVLVVKITLENGKIVTSKIIY